MFRIHKHILYYTCTKQTQKNIADPTQNKTRSGTPKLSMLMKILLRTEHE